MDQTEQFMTLLLAHQGELRALIGALVRDRAERDDVFQETAIALWKSFDRYDPARPFAAWARGVAANKLLQRRDQLAGRPQPLSPESFAAVAAAFDETPAESPRQEKLRECLDALPLRSRELLRLRYETALAIEAVAEKVATTAAAVQKTLSRLREALRACVDRRLGATR